MSHGKSSSSYEVDFTGLAPGDYVDTQLRLKADVGTPNGFGMASTCGGFYDENGGAHSGVLSGYWFETVAAGSDAGRIPSATGRPATGTKPARQGDVKDLATTGKPTSSGTGTFAATGGRRGQAGRRAARRSR
ncbi:hypothetical protein [Streptomyces venezuelae]|uniref:hypothetical protein n=1 Tax=Streptomyces venezuelae TaxID=54571 RepID=UPI00342CE088